MKIVSAYIRAFGTIEDKKIEFNDNLNSFLNDNGSGKSTLVAYIRAMFYGLNDKRTTKFDDRTNYLPWSGVLCGGNLIIETSEKLYRIERSFAKKSQDDGFKLFDERTGLESSDYGPDIGERLLGVDKEAFDKSIYFGQGDLTTRISDSLNAKMGSLTDVRDDINKFDEAIKRLENAQKIYDRKGAKNPGKIPVIEAQIKECERILEKIPATENAILQRKGGIEEKSQRIIDITREREQLSTEIKRTAAVSENYGRAKAINEQLKKTLSEQAELEEFFKDYIPTQEDIIKMQDSQMALIEKESRSSQIEQRLPSEERRSFLISVFGQEDSVTKEFLEKAKTEAEALRSLRNAGRMTSFSQEDEKSLEEYRRIFEDKTPNQEEINSMMEVQKTVNAHRAKNEALLDNINRLKQKLSEIDTPKSFGIEGGLRGLPGLLVLLCGLAILVFLENLPSIIGIMLIVFGLFLMAFMLTGLFRKNQSRKTEGKELEKELKALETEYLASQNTLLDREDLVRSFIKKYIDENTEPFDSLIKIKSQMEEYKRLLGAYETAKQDMAKNVDALAELQMNLYTRLAPFASKYGYSLYEDNREGELIQKLSEDINEYDNYLDDLKNVASLKPEIDEERGKLEGFLNKFKWEEEKSDKERLLDIKSKMDSYMEKRDTIERLRADLKQYDIPEGYEEDENIITQKQNKIKELDEILNELISEKAREEEALTALRNEIDELEESTRKLPALREELEQMQKKVEIYLETKEYLTKARDSFLQRYMKPLKDGMDKYTQKLMPIELREQLEITVDMELSVSVSYKGSSYPKDHLSQGYKDMANICARMALIDVLYKDEKPPIILDDPFTNLDEGRIENALDLVRQIAADTQVIYMTCHKSRVGGDFNKIII